VLGDRDQSQEQLPECLLLVEGQPVVQLVGPSAQRALRPAHLPVGGGGEHIALATLEQLRQGVLEERERAGLADHVSQQFGDQRRFERHTAGSDRLLGRGLQLVGRQG
jgi:hypothetical protein